MIEKDFTHGGNIYKASKELGISKHKIVDFSANINPLGMSRLGVKGIKNGLNNILNYPDPDYTELNIGLAEFYGVNSSYLTLSNGAIESIYTYVKSRPIGKALIPAPGFVEYEKALIRGGWEVTFYSNKSQIDPKYFDSIFICNPNNPTGFSYSKSFILELLKECEKYNTDLFLDEAFIDFSSYDSMVKFTKDYKSLFILKSLTKFFAVPGLRIGGLITSNSNFLEKSRELTTPWSINSVAQSYILSAIKDFKYIKKSSEYVKKERYLLYRELSKIEQIKVYRSQGNYLFFKNLSDIDLGSELKKIGILIRSCKNYNNLTKRDYRVAVKKRKFNILLIKSIKQIIGKG